MEAEHGPLWAALLRAIADLVAPGVRVMDFGCNRGGLLAVLAGGYETIWKGVEPSLAVGVDVDTAAMRSLLRTTARRGKLLFTTASPHTFPGQFDLVLSHEVVYLLPDLPGVFAGLNEALLDGGHLCITTGGHVENPLYVRWRRALERNGVRAEAYREVDYEEALRRAGLRNLRRARLLLSEDEYDHWVSTRPERAPNPDWFPSAAEEKHYYVAFGKPIFIAQRPLAIETTS